MPAVIVRRGDVRPASTCDCSEQASASHDFREDRVWASGQEVPQKDQGKARTGSDRDKELEDRAFGVAVSNRRRNGRKPLVRVTVELVLDNFVIVEG